MAAVSYRRQISYLNSLLADFQLDELGIRRGFGPVDHRFEAAGFRRRADPLDVVGVGRGGNQVGRGTHREGQVRIGVLIVDVVEPVRAAGVCHNNGIRRNSSRVVIGRIATEGVFHQIFEPVVFHIGIPVGIGAKQSKGKRP